MINSISSFLQKHWISILIITVSVFFHLYQLDSIPSDLYLDETSIGLNAHYISRNLTDQYGDILPIYFKAFGEYKNPIYIYTNAFIFRFLDPSQYIFGLRFTSFVFWIIFFIGTYKLACLISESKTVRHLSLLIASFSPFIFQISRISFEVISQASFQVWLYYFLFKYHKDKNNKWFFISILLLAISYYSYSTSKLYALLILPAILIYGFLEKVNKKTIILSVISFILVLLPAFIFNLSSNAVTERFSEITYLFSTDMTVGEKVIHFTLKYFSNFNPIFLFVSGDSNPRHSAIFGGETFLVMGICLIVYLRWKKKDSLDYLLLVLFILSPIPTSIVGGSYHGLRSLVMFLSLLPITLIATDLIKNPKVLGVIIWSTLIQILLYLIFYFSQSGYSNLFFDANENYGFNNVIYKLQELKSSTIYLDTKMPSVHKDFYEIVINQKFITDPNNIAPKSCVILDQLTQDKYPSLKTYFTQNRSKYMIKCNY